MNRIAILAAVAGVLAGCAAPAPPADGWRPLFNGKDLEGWEGDAKLWSVEDGVLVGRANKIPKNSYLFSKESFGDFVVEFDVLLKGGNSGLQFRSKKMPDGDVRGYQADIGEVYWGSLYHVNRGAVAKAKEEDWKRALKTNDWNRYVVRAEGQRIRIEINGVTTIDIRDKDEPEGVLAFQLHVGHNMELRIRNARIKSLK